MTSEQLTDQDIADLTSIGIDPEEATAPKRTLLESWTLLLDSADSEDTSRISPADAVRLLQRWPDLKVQELPAYSDIFLGKVNRMRAHLREVIESDPKAFSRAEEDATKNHELYLAVILAWNIEIEGWQLSWDCTDSDAYVRLAVIADAQNMFMGPQGIIHHLDQIGFDISDEEAQALGDELEAAREAK